MLIVVKEYSFIGMVCFGNLAIMIKLMENIFDTNHGFRLNGGVGGIWKFNHVVGSW